LTSTDLPDMLRRPEVVVEKTDRITERIREMLGLRRTPIKVGFFAEPPPGVERWAGGPAPTGCFFWARAMEGKTFYTVAEDHYNCALGSYTHRIGLPPDRATELESTIGFMADTRYLDAAELGAIPTLPATPAAVAYAPAGSDAFRADVIVIGATPAQATLIYEAALRSGLAGPQMNAAFSRPGCAILPVSTCQDALAVSFGCKGTRTFTDLADEEMYLSLPGPRWDEIAGRLFEVQRSNLTMGNYYQAQRAKHGKG
jgi:uncharacterized protein (DUF169 family)